LYFYDLHVHSCLSPCADDDMSPANICAMARLKGLDIISLTDHNTAGNLESCMEAAAREGLLFVPGMELCTREEVHLLAYFPDLTGALAAGKVIRTLLPGIPNRPERFGRQLLMDSRDLVLGEEDALLIGALDLGLEQACDLVRNHGGVPVPAHIHRGHGLVRVLGFVPPDAGFHTVETAPGEALPSGCRAIHSSDAHQLGMISEPLYKLPSGKDIASLLRFMALPAN
jgi:hypothetical protein